MTWTDADFERLSWHDCHVWRFAIHGGDPDRNDWTSDLVLDLDFIVEWLCDTAGAATFRVAPARLTFHGVTDLDLAVSWGDSNHRKSLHEMSIDRIERAQVADQQVFLDRPYYRYIVHTSWPAGGRLSFGAAGFTQHLLSAPVLKQEQRLTRAERMRAEGGEKD